ncbi:MAG TPA: VWA domain-containing protein [Chloroflexota bacterium]|nr:VWA domain-containing protein [Chloroflexota bacterium]
MQADNVPGGRAPQSSFGPRLTAFSRYRYSRWDGTQQVSPFDADEIMENLADDLLGDGDVRSALQRILQRGFQHRSGDRTMGLQNILERLRAARQRQLDRHDLGGMIDQIREKLEDVLRTEREGIQRRLEEARARSQQPPSGVEQGAEGAEDADAGSQGREPRGPTSQGQQQAGSRPSGQQPGSPTGQDGGPQGPSQPSSSPSGPSPLEMLENIAGKKLQYLDDVPQDIGGAVQALNDYDFMDPEAREKFQELLRMLQQQVLQSYFQGMQQSMQSLSPEDMAAMRQMLQDLNQMLRDRAEGREPDFDQFMQRWGQNFPGDITNLDDLVEHIQQRIGQMQSILQSMSPDQRRQLQEMAEQLMEQAGLSEELAELADLLDQMAPGARSSRQYPFRGDEPVSLAEAMQIMEQLQELDALERQIQQARDLSSLEDLDIEKVRQLLGDDEANALEQLRELQKILEEAGYVTRRGNEMELTARGMRKIGEKALTDIFHNLKRDSFGKHPMNYRGPGGERVDESKIYEFGDPFSLDMQKTLMNSVVREGPGTPVRLTPDDFEVYRHELVTQSSTVIVLDMSRSMFLRGCILAAKKVAVALNSLIKGLYPRDNLYIIAFSYYAREINTEDLPHLSWSEWGYGTNMQHAFMVSRQLLARHRGGTKQVILVTDGEPTAYFEGGQIEFSYPPTYRTFQETLREVSRCTRENIRINTFMMERGRYLTDFVDQMTKINRGRAFYATPDRLGEYILVDYVDNKRKTIR